MQGPISERAHLDARLLIGLGFLGLILRVCNLGTFSLWLDEILTLHRAKPTLAATWHACFTFLEHPPIPVLVLAIGKATLKKGPQTISAVIPGRLLKPGENLLTLQLAYAIAPNRSPTARRLSAAIDWIELSEE